MRLRMSADESFLRGRRCWRPHRSRLRELLAGKEGLGLSTGGVGAQWTAEGQLAGTDHVGLQVGLDQVCQSLDRRLEEPGRASICSM